MGVFTDKTEEKLNYTLCMRFLQSYGSEQLLNYQRTFLRA